MGISNRGPRGVPGRGSARLVNMYRTGNQDPPAAGGAWTSQTFTTSSTFTAPSGSVALNKRGKVEVFITATAGGAAGGDGVNSGADPYVRAGQGGEAGQWSRRYLVELNPGEQVTVTIPGTSTTNGNSFSFGTYLTLTGGTAGTAGTSSAGSPVAVLGYNGVSGTIVSGSVANNTAIRRGARGGRPRVYNSGLICGETSGDANMTMGAYEGGVSGGGDLVTSSNNPGGGGGAGLFGAGGRAGGDTGSAANGATDSGAGGGGGGSPSPIAKGNGAGGQCLIEWRIAA